MAERCLAEKLDTAMDVISEFEEINTTNKIEIPEFVEERVVEPKVKIVREDLYSDDEKVFVSQQPTEKLTSFYEEKSKWDALLKQWLFYPDYIVHLKDGTDWIIETKGGEVSGHSKNIDMQIGNKFNAFRQYAEKYKLHWGFVRDINEELFINNTEFVDDMSDGNWVDLSEKF